MTSAQNNPVKPKYTREIHTGDMPITQKADVDLDEPIVHGEGLVNVSGDLNGKDSYLAALAFMEEPVTIRVEENSRSDFPETHVPVSVNGRGAEVFMNGQWVAMTWIPIGQPLVTKRKYVELLARAKSDNVRTKHEDANVEKPQNRVERRSSSNYPLSVLEDRNPRGAEWLSRILMGY